MMLSVIIPVYNARRTLEACIKSIISQNGNFAYEIILIDDGSIDGSGDLCDRFEDIYSHIRVIHQQNGGVSRARQTGINAASGEWIMFVDADDTLLANISEIPYESYTNADVIVFERSLEEPFSPLKMGDQKEIINLILGVDCSNKSQNSKMFSVWSKLYRRSFLMHQGIVFSTELVNGEDMIFNVQCVQCGGRFIHEDMEIYQYNENSASVTHSLNRKIINNDRTFLVELKKLLPDIREDYYHIIALRGLFICIRHYIAHRENKIEFAHRRALLMELITEEPYRSALHSDLCTFNSLSVPQKIVLLCCKLKLYDVALLIAAI